MALSDHTIQSLGMAMMNVDAAKTVESAISNLDAYVVSLNSGVGPPTPDQSSNTSVIATTEFVNRIVYSTGDYYSTGGGF